MDLKVDDQSVGLVKGEEYHKGESSGVLNAISIARSELEKLLATIDELVEQPDTYNGSTKLVLYFDEAHPLMNTDLDSKAFGKTLYDALCSRLNTFLNYPMFVIFLSTAFHLARFAPPGALAASARIRHSPKTLQAPITETPFDCFPDFIIKPRTLRLKDIITVEFMAQFGRPM